MKRVGKSLQPLGNGLNLIFVFNYMARGNLGAFCAMIEISE